MQNQSNRMPPTGMPSQPPRPDRSALYGKKKPRPAMPEQKPVTDEEEVRKPSPFVQLLKRIGLGILLMLALVAAYLFLLLGEPEEEAKYAAPISEEVITMPMSALDVPGEADVQYLADTFRQPVLSIGSGVSMQKARIYDTALHGGYARRVTLTYAFEDGTQLLVESMRPTSAVSLLKQSGYTLDATALYSLGGLNAARMDNAAQTCVFGQSDTAVYAVICPASHADELANLLRYTSLTAPSAAE